MSTPSSSKPQPNLAPAEDVDVDLDKLLNREARAFERQIEVERILKAFKLKSAFSLRILLCSLTVPSILQPIRYP